MTAEQAIALARAIRPNELEEEVLAHWILELEQNLALLVRNEGSVACNGSPVTRADLRIPAPFDRVYWTYLVAMIDLSLGDQAAYGISYPLFEETRNAYARWYQSHAGGKL